MEPRDLVRCVETPFNRRRLVARDRYPSQLPQVTKVMVLSTILLGPPT